MSSKIGESSCLKKILTRPEKTNSCCDNFASQNIDPEKWKENVRMSRDTF